MTGDTQKIGWIGLGRMGSPMAERLIRAGNQVAVWNRTRAKAEPLAAIGGRIVDQVSDLADCDVVFSMVSTGKDLLSICFGEGGLASKGGRLPKIFVDCSTIGLEDSGAAREQFEKLGVEYVSCPVSGNGKCAAAGILSAVMSGTEGVCESVRPYIEAFAPRGVSYVGEGDLARVCKIAHNVMLGVVIENLIEITILAQKAGVSRYAFLEFMNNSVMGSTFTRYKAPALVNLDWTTTFTPELLRKDLDLGLHLAEALGVVMPVTAATRQVVQSHFGAATLQQDPERYLQGDFAALLETMALASGLQVKSEQRVVLSGLEGAQTAPSTGPAKRDPQLV